jgi:hypothetical protein
MGDALVGGDEAGERRPMGTCSVGKLCGMQNDRIFVCI